jgi:hypothetical protein
MTMRTTAAEAFAATIDTCAPDQAALSVHAL